MDEGKKFDKGFSLLKRFVYLSIQITPTTSSINHLKFLGCFLTW